MNDKSTPEQRGFLTFAEMCAALNVSRPTLRQMVLDGRVHASRLSDTRSSHYRFALDEPQRYLERSRIRPLAS